MESFWVLWILHRFLCFPFPIGWVLRPLSFKKDSEPFQRFANPPLTRRCPACGSRFGVGLLPRGEEYRKQTANRISSIHPAADPIQLKSFQRLIVKFPKCFQIHKFTSSVRLFNIRLFICFPSQQLFLLIKTKISIGPVVFIKHFD